MKARRIPLKTLEPSGPKKNDGFSYYEMLKTHYEGAPSQGVTVGQMRKALGMLDSLEAEKDGEFWTIAEADHKELVDRLEKEPWRIVTRNIVTFIDDVTHAEQIDHV